MLRDELERLVANARPLLYPCTIVRTRRAGTYEAGRWAAFRCPPEEVPSLPFGDDLAASAWWHGEDAGWVGLGASPDQAFRMLVKRWAERGCRECRGLGVVPVERRGTDARRVCHACAGRGRDEPDRCARHRSRGPVDRPASSQHAPVGGPDAPIED